MKYLKIAGLALASMLVIGMALAGTASAAVKPLWLACLEGNNPKDTKYLTNQCTTVGNNEDRWQSLAVKTPFDATRLLAFSLRLVDTKTLTGTSGTKCNMGGEGEGEIGNENEGEIKTAAVKEPKTNCEGIGGCEKNGVEEVNGIHLPWKTTLAEGPEEMAKGSLAGTGGNPGWKIKCKTILGSKTDECESETGKPEELTLLSGVTKGVLLILARFLTHLGLCKEGGKEAGEVSGLVAILLKSGNGLSIKLSK
jgi:hypothetical protein